MDANPRWIHAIAIITLALLALLLSCAEETSPETIQPPEQTVDELVVTTGWFPTIVPDSTVYSIARFDSTDAGNGLMCGEFVGFQVKEVAALTVLTADAGIHYAGSVLQYAHLGDLAPAVVVGDRAGGSMTLTGADGTALFGELDAVGAATVEAWRQQTLPSLPQASGSWQLALHSIRDPQQIALGAAVHPSALPTAVSDELQPRDLDRARVLVRLQRTHHSVGCAYPGRASNAFADHVRGADLADQMAEGNPPVWVERVHHGQLLLLLIEADTDFDSLAEAVENSLTAAVAGTSPDPALLSLADLSGLDASGYAVAGDAAAAVAAVLAGGSELADLLAAPVADPAALPVVSADLLALRNGGPLTLGLEDDFAFTACEFYEPVYDEVIWGIDPADARVERTDTDLHSDGSGEFIYNGGVLEQSFDLVTTVPDLKGLGLPSVPSQFGRRPILWHDMANGHPVIELYELGLPDGHIFSELRFDGTPFVTTPYTLFLVVGLPVRVRLTVVAEPEDYHISRLNAPNHIIEGDPNGIRGNLIIGWDDGWLRYAHHPQSLDVPDTPPWGWHIYAFRFGTSGMAIYEDGELLGDTDWNFSLLQLSGTTLAARQQGFQAPGHAVLWLAEAVAYRGEGTEDMVLQETERLREKFGIEP